MLLRLLTLLRAVVARVTKQFVTPSGVVVETSAHAATAVGFKPLTKKPVAGKKAASKKPAKGAKKTE